MHMLFGQRGGLSGICGVWLIISRIRLGNKYGAMV